MSKPSYKKSEPAEICLNCDKPGLNELLLSLLKVVGRQTLNQLVFSF